MYYIHTYIHVILNMCMHVCGFVAVCMYLCMCVFYNAAEGLLQQLAPRTSITIFDAIDGLPGLSIADRSYHRESIFATSGPLVFAILHAINGSYLYIATNDMWLYACIRHVTHLLIIFMSLLYFRLSSMQITVEYNVMYDIAAYRGGRY